MIKKIIGMISLSFLLIGCEREVTYDYLIKNLSILKQDLRQCEKLNNSQSDMTVAQKNKCEIVMLLAANLVSLINEEQNDPQQFGKKILSAERDFSTAKADLEKAQQNLLSLKQKNAEAMELQTAEKMLKQAEQTYHKRAEDMKLFLAVLSLNSPE